MLSKHVPSLTSKKTHSPPPAPRPVLTQPPTLMVCPTCTKSVDQRNLHSLQASINICMLPQGIKFFRVAFLPCTMQCCLDKTLVLPHALHRLLTGGCWRSSSFRRTSSRGQSSFQPPSLSVAPAKSKVPSNAGVAMVSNARQVLNVLPSSRWSP